MPHLRLPGAQVAGVFVDEEDRRAGAGLLVIEAHAVIRGRVGMPVLLFAGWKQLRPVAREGPPARPQAPERRRDLGDRGGRVRRVQQHEIRGVADCDAVIGQAHQPRRSLGYHGEAVGQLDRAADVADIGVEIGHAHQRAVAIGRERVEHVVGRDRAGDAAGRQRSRADHAARNGVVVTSGP